MSVNRSGASSENNKGRADQREPVTLTILGGSSAFMPGLAVALADASASLPALSVRLYGRDIERLDCIARFCNRHAQFRGVCHDYSHATSLRDSVTGAGIVVNLMRVGGWSGRYHDERFSVPFGIPGDETIGPGGLSSALRSLPLVLEAARETVESSPDAWFINMGNPMGILLGGLRRIERLRYFGLCELPAVTLRHALDLIDMRKKDVTADYLGLNHQGWFVRIDKEGKDLLPDLFETMRLSPEAGFFQVEASVMAKIGALPVPYMRHYYHTVREVERLRERGSSRAEELKELSDRLYSWYRTSDSPDLPQILHKRSMPWFPMALVPAITALTGGGERELYVSDVNDGDIPGLPPHAIVEKRSLLFADGPRMIPFAGPQPEEGSELEPFLELLRHILHFERACVEAALDPCDETVMAALRAHPLCTDEDAAHALTPLVLQSVEDQRPTREYAEEKNDTV